MMLCYGIAMISLRWVVETEELLEILKETEDSAW